jgi:16S rRNA (cytidine1402-2'-O)-methyltransferase
MNQPERYLYLIPSTLGDSIVESVLPSATIEIIKSLNHFVVEEERTARRFLIRAGYDKPISSVSFFILNEHTELNHISAFFELSGKANLGLLSEAGVPAVADPGAELVKAAFQYNVRVVPLVGPSSILLAMMASGLNGQNFAFNGYLPVKSTERAARIKYFEKRSVNEGQSQVFIEAPYRNNQLVKALIENCKPDTYLCIASNLTLNEEWIRTKTIRDWQRNIPDINRIPAVFILQS